MGIDLGAQSSCTKSACPNGVPKITTPCSLVGRFALPLQTMASGSTGCELQHVDIRRLHLAPVPNPSFPLVCLYPGVVPQLHSQLGVNVDDPLRSTHNGDVVKESQEVFVREQTISHGNQSSVLAHRERSWHQWVALLAALSLDDLVSHSQVILPNAWKTAKLYD